MRRLRPTTLLLALLLAVVSTFPLVLWPRRVTAWTAGEADNHLWMHWQAAHPNGPWANWPQGTGLPLMDPVNLPWFALGFLVDPAFAWNLAWFGNVLIALLGGAWLGREATGRLAGAWVGMSVLGTAPVLHGLGLFGLTEAWPLGFLALHAAALLAWGRWGRIRHAVVASLALGAFVASGGYHALFAALAVPFVALWAARRDAWDRRRWAGLVLVGIGAALVAAPALRDALATHALLADRIAGTPAATPSWDPGWRQGPVHGGADLLNLVLPQRVHVPSGRSVYLGLTVLLLAGVGLATRRRERRGMGLLAAGIAALLLLALGRTVEVAGYVVSPYAPADLLVTLAPPLSGITHWYRAVAPAVVLLVPLAAQGAVVLLDDVDRPRGAALGLALLVAFEGMLLSGNAWPRPQYDPRPPEGLEALPGEGPLVLLPFDNARGEFGAGVPRIYDRWGPWLERPLSEHYEGPDALLVENRLVAAANTACGAVGTDPWARRPTAAFADPERMTPEVAHGALRALERRRAEWIVVLPRRAADDERCTALLEGLLGAPAHRSAEVVGWRIETRPDGPADR